MLDKTVATLAAAVKDIRDGATLLVSGFGSSGVPPSCCWRCSTRARANSRW
jgi:acyl CoA:acetate/3-ketoacid CoA transferase alpha subunit